MSLSKDCAQHVANVVFGTAALAFTPLTGTGAVVAGAAVTIAALVGIELNKAKPGDRKQIRGLIADLADQAYQRIEGEGQGRYRRASQITKATKALNRYLPELDIKHGQLGRDAFDEGGFPKAATRRIVKAVVEAEAADETVAPDKCLFQGGEKTAEALAFVNGVFDHAFGLALTNRDYFESLEPHLIVGIAEGIGDLKRGQEAQGGQLSRIEAMLAAKTGLTVPQVEAILKSFGHEGIPPEQWESALFASAQKLKALEARLDLPSNDGPEITSLLDLAREAIDRADFDAAERHLSEAERRDTEAGEQRLRRAADSREKRAELAEAQGRYIEAADHYAEAAKLMRPFDEMDWARLKYNEGNVAYERGLIFPEPGALDQSVAAYRAALEVCTREAAPTDWATTQNNLGNALQILGERGQDGALEDAVTAYRAALEVRTREAAPMNWAMTQNNLGNTLQVLGKRGQDGALEAAVTAYRAALEVRTREAAPMQWAMTQNNLGNALATLGVRGQDGALEEAVTAFRAALQVLTFEAAPMNWAATQNNLGVALEALGGRGQDGALEEAVTAYRAALEEYTREAAPMRWAGTQNNLGGALQRLGERGQEGALEEAVTAYRAALKVYTREAAPMQWAITQENLALTLEVLADQEDNPRGRLEAALEAVCGALEVFRAVGATYNIEKAERLEARVREKLAAL